jgi:hypothetical protein
MICVIRAEREMSATGGKRPLAVSFDAEAELRHEPLSELRSIGDYANQA